MMNNALMLSSILLWIVVLFNLLLTIALIRRSNVTQPSFDMTDVPTLEIGSKAPSFEAETLDGNTVTLADFAGQSVAFIFTSPTCKPCIEKLPSINNISKSFHDHGLEIVLVSIATLDESRAFAQQREIHLPVIVADPNGNSLMHDYKVAGTPFYCVLSHEGKIVSTGFLGPAWDEFAGSFLVEA